MAYNTVYTSASLANHPQAYGGIIIVVALSFLVSTTFGSLVDGLACGAIPGGTALIGAIESTGQLVDFGVVGMGYPSMRDDWEPIRFERPTAHDALRIAGGFIAVMGVYLSVSALMSVLDIQNGGSVIAQQGREDPVYFLYLTIVITIPVDPAGELIFHGIAFGELRQLWGPALAVVPLGLVFASIHLWPFFDGRLYVSLGMVLVLGSVFAVVCERGGGLLVVTLIHGLYNMVQFLVSYAQVTGLV